MRFNHMELTLEEGALDEPSRTLLIEFYRSVFGWNPVSPNLFDESDLLFTTDESASSFLLLYQGDKAMHAPGFDHLGILLDTREQVDQLLSACKEYRALDEDVVIREYDDLVQGDLTVHAFYVKYRLPIYLDVQCFEWAPGKEPARRWRFE